MSAGKSFKFHGSEIQVMTGFSADSPNKVITGISNADPAVVSSTNHGLTDGDVVKLTGIVGMTELNDELFVVVNAASGTFELADVDSSDYGDYESGGVIDVAEFSNFCELTNYNRAGGAKPEEQTTSLCSDAQEYELGLPDFGTTSIDYKFAPRTAIQEAIKEFDDSGDKMAVKVTLPKNGGVMVQLAFVQSTSETAGVGGIWRGSMSLRNTGSRVDIEA